MKVKSHGITLDLTLEEAIALSALLGNMSILSMIEQGVDAEEAKLLQEIYGTLSAFLPEREAA